MPKAKRTGALPTLEDVRRHERLRDARTEAAAEARRIGVAPGLLIVDRRALEIPAQGGAGGRIRLTDAGRERADAVYDYIVAYKRLCDGNVPTLREIARAVGLGSWSTVGYYIDILLAEGRLYVLPGSRRGKSVRFGVTGGMWTVETDVLDLKAEPR